MEQQFIAPNKKDVIKKASIDIVVNFKSEYGATWKDEAIKSIDNELDKFKASLEFWSKIKENVNKSK
jgi:hypothetical protein